MRKLIHLLLALIILSCSSPANELPAAKETAATVNQEFTITNLYDAFGKPGEGLTHDFGFSAVVTYHGKTIMFDAGTNADILKRNAQALGVDLSTVDYAVASHAHGDHINGFDYLLKVNPEVTLYLPFDFYTGARINFNVTGKEAEMRDSLPPHMQYFGGQKNLDLTINQSGRFWNANTKFIAENTEIEPGVHLIATRSPYLGYGSKYPSVEEIQGAVSPGADGDIAFAGLPELSLSLTTDQGEVILVGCSHSSVQNIIVATKEMTGSPIQLVYGGYHMLPYGREEVTSVAKHLKNELAVAQVAPTHCTGHLAFKLLQDIYQQDYLFAGLGETLVIRD